MGVGSSACVCAWACACVLLRACACMQAQLERTYFTAQWTGKGAVFLLTRMKLPDAAGAEE